MERNNIAMFRNRSAFVSRRLRPLAERLRLVPSHSGDDSHRKTTTSPSTHLLSCRLSGIMSEGRGV